MYVLLLTYRPNERLGAALLSVCCCLFVYSFVLMCVCVCVWLVGWVLLSVWLLLLLFFSVLGAEGGERNKRPPSQDRKKKKSPAPPPPPPPQQTNQSKAQKHQKKRKERRKKEERKKGERKKRKNAMNSLKNLFGGKPKGKDELEATQRNEALKEKCKRIMSLNTELLNEWKALQKISNDYIAQSVRVGAALKKYGMDRGDGLLVGEEMEVVQSMWAAVTKQRSIFHETAISKVTSTISLISQEAENYTRHHKQTCKTLLAQQIDLKDTIMALNSKNSGGGSDLDKLNQTTKMWHQAAVAYKEAEGEWTSWIQDYQIEESYRLLSSLFALCRAAQTEAKVNYFGIGEASSSEYDHSLSTYETAVAMKQHSYTVHKNARDAEVMRLKKLNDPQLESSGNTKESLMSVTTFDVQFKHW